MVRIKVVLKYSEGCDDETIRWLKSVYFVVFRTVRSHFQFTCTLLVQLIVRSLFKEVK